MSASPDNSRFDSYLQQAKDRINQALRTQLGSFKSPYTSIDSYDYLERLREAMAYSLLNGGKRVRALLVYAAAEAVAGERAPPLKQQQEQQLEQHLPPLQLDNLAGAVEMIHAYSLIHDDLPAMDDDDLRRGKPSCHRAFDEATAILAGDALQTRAFELIIELDGCPAQTQLQLLSQLSTASGARGMVGGQAIDLAAVDRDIDLTHLEALHRMKTGALIRAAVTMGATFAGATSSQMASLDEYAECIGLAFQVQDDILDIESDTATLGKTQGADQALNKPTYPALLGMAGAKDKARQLDQQAQQALASFGPAATPLRDLSTYIISRRH